MITLKIIEHSGVEHITQVAEYNAKETFMELIKARVENPFMLLVGDIIVDARVVQSIKEVPEPTPTEEEPTPTEPEPTPQ